MKEPQNDPIWATRVAVLAPLIVGHMTTPMVQLVAKRELKWPENLTLNVLAAGERRDFFSKDGEWRLPGAGPRQHIGRVQPEQSLLPTRACKFCTQVFVPRRTKMVFCSGNCRSAAGRKRAA
jgi:hypothetical protein